MKCPICRNPMPKQLQARRVASSGIVVCADARCEQRANDLDRCEATACVLPQYALDLCRGHYAQYKRGATLRQLRDPEAEARVVLSLRVSPRAKLRASTDPWGAREAIEKWAKRR